MCLLCCCVDNEVFVIKKVPNTASDDGDEEVEDNERTLGRNEVDSDATDIDEELRLSKVGKPMKLIKWRCTKKLYRCRNGAKVKHVTVRPVFIYGMLVIGA